MELWRSAANPWGQEVLIGISWDLMWAALIVGFAFAAGHAVWKKWIAPAASTGAAEGSGIAGLPAKILRHAMTERVFHWGMAVVMLVLLVTAFAPVIGVQFAWVTIHWWAGAILTAMIVYHMIHATFWQDFWAMWVDKADIKAGIAELGHIIGRNGTEVPKAAKYPMDHKMFHHGAAVTGLAAIVTGIPMTLRIETPFWAANPYLLQLQDSTWGLVFVVHGVAGVGLIGLVILHIYFSVRPDKWWITKSMIFGFITPEKYVEVHDPSRWEIAGVTPQEELLPAAVGASEGVSDATTAGGDDAPSDGGGGDGEAARDSNDDRASEVGGLD